MLAQRRAPRSVRNGEVESGAGAGLRFQPDPAAAQGDDALGDGQAHAGARILVTMQALEEAEDLVMIARVDANPVVANRKGHGFVSALSGHMNLRRSGSVEFQRSEERRVGKECRSRW